MAEKISTPLAKKKAEQLRAGEEVLISGIIYSARDMAHKRLTETIARSEPLPIDLEGQIIYFVGPSPASPGRPAGSAGPTTSSRMDPFSPILLDNGLAGMIGKGYRGDAVINFLIKNKAVHFSAVGGAGALLSKSIVKSEVVAYHDLGPEAIRRLEVLDFPAVVAYDSRGASIYERK
ncbi:Fumarate hydratase class I, anaerobic [Sedimentisphaera cyanobacteriorum]|uniref:Fumarate hydratase class I, anaerobic n=1 Tax=Sedimentisphaera cyanobacteriorum TaxID=1940790 RepID=A0A1Q2HLX9_9BACT|nr:Fe-S-containing hydro-lyase [Sedimentisphaera cyanobacteriorum]AQQ08458.1 Fumarate hydratase class I, anaerobic [Sedimentisphaera cyanobacteriorum]